MALLFNLHHYTDTMIYCITLQHFIPEKYCSFPTKRSYVGHMLVKKEVFTSILSRNLRFCFRFIPVPSEYAISCDIVELIVRLCYHNDKEGRGIKCLSLPPN